MTIYVETGVRKAADSTAIRIIAIWLCGFCPMLGVYATQPLLPGLSMTFHVTESAAGLTITATTLAIAIMAPLIGLLADAVGRKLVIVTALFGLSIPLALAATSNTLNELILWRFAQGLFIPGVFSITLAYISEEWSAGDRGWVTSAYVSGSVFGSVFGRIISGIVASYFGWHESFLMLSFMLIIGGLLVAFLLPASKSFEKNLDAVGGMKNLIGLISSGGLLPVWIVAFNTLFVFVGIFTYITFYLTGLPFLLSATSLSFMFLVNIVGAVFTPFAGRWMDRAGYRKGLLGAVAISVLGVVLTLCPSIWFILIGITLVSIGTFVANSAASSHLSMIVGKGKSSAAGLYVGSYYVGGSVGAVVPGLIFSSEGWLGCVMLFLIALSCSWLIVIKFWRVPSGANQAAS
jgi:MFS family permease